MVEITEPDKSFVSTADVSGSRRLSGDVLPLNMGAPDKKKSHMDIDPYTAKHSTAV